jgi:hypothetical protein
MNTGTHTSRISIPTNDVGEVELGNISLRVNEAMDDMRTNGVSQHITGTMQSFLKPTVLFYDGSSSELDVSAMNPSFEYDIEENPDINIRHGGGIEPRHRYHLVMYRQMFNYICRCICDMLLLHCRNIMSLLYAYHRLVYRKRKIDGNKRCFCLLFHPARLKYVSFHIPKAVQFLPPLWGKLANCNFDTLDLYENVSMLFVTSNDEDTNNLLQEIYRKDRGLDVSLIISYIYAMLDSNLPSIHYVRSQGVAPQYHPDTGERESFFQWFDLEDTFNISLTVFRHRGNAVHGRPNSATRATNVTLPTYGYGV